MTTDWSELAGPILANSDRKGTETLTITGIEERGLT